MFSILKKLTKFSEKSRNFSSNFSWNRQNHLLKLIFQCWKNWRCFLMKIEFFVQILFQKLKITNQNQLLNLKQIQEKIKILSNENSKPEGIWKVIIQKVSSTKRKLDGKYWKMNRFLCDETPASSKMISRNAKLDVFSLVRVAEVWGP